jgi:protein arginine kinase
MIKWYEQENENYNSVIISSRIRLARNLVDYPFPNRLTSEKALEMIERVKSSLTTKEDFDDKYKIINMKQISQIDKIAMMERHVISPLFINMTIPTYLIMSKDESKSIMLNEEDHIRIQSMNMGMNLRKSLEEANAIDDSIEENTTYAFHDKLGYLTACPTNVGTGLRASYMMHVPALETTGQLQFILEAIGKFGLTVRGVHGEGSKSQGSVFQISNQVTLGLSESEIIDNLTSVIKQIVDQEINIREKLLKEKRLQFEDAVYRSYGILSNARILSSSEAMTLLSDMKLGFELGLIKSEESKQINIFELMTCIGPANLQKIEHKDLSIEQRDIARANYIRENLPKIIGG